MLGLRAPVGCQEESLLPAGSCAEGQRGAGSDQDRGALQFSRCDRPTLNFSLMTIAAPASLPQFSSLSWVLNAHMVRGKQLARYWIWSPPCPCEGLFLRSLSKCAVSVVVRLFLPPSLLLGTTLRHHRPRPPQPCPAVTDFKAASSCWHPRLINVPRPRDRGRGNGLSLVGVVGR